MKSRTIKFSAAIMLLVILTVSYFEISTFRHRLNKEENEGLTAYEMMGLWGEMRAYPFDAIPQEKFNGAYQRMKSDEARYRRNVTSGMSTAANGQTTPWTPLAPKNFSGRILCLGFDPVDQNVIWAGSASGGLWKTTNGGTGATNGINWTNVPTGFPVLGIPAIAVNPSNRNEIYVGTGEIYSTGNYGYGGHNERTFRGSYGIGIIKSVDGGTTWTKALDFSASSLKGVADIIINPSRTATVYAATTDGVYRSFDAGSTWTLIHNVPMAMDICLKPGDTSTLYVGTGDLGSAGTGIYKTTNAGAATPTFTQLTNGLPTGITGMIRLNISANNVNKVYASIGKSPTGTNANGLYSSTDGGTTWTKASTTAYINNQGWYAHDVVASPTNANTIYVSEMDMYKSTTGGGTLTKISDWSLWNFNNTTVGTQSEGTKTNYVHADIHHLYISPFSSTTVFAVSDGGVFKTTNGTSFIALNGGLQTAQIYANMAVSTTDPNFMICGLQDNATFLYQGNPGCVRKIGGDGFSAATTPGNDNICFGSLYYFTIYKSTNKGSTFSTVNDNSSGNEKACFSSPLAMSKSSPSTLYGGTIYVKKSTNQGSTWANANGGAVLSNSSAPIIKMTVSNTNANKLYASTCPGGGARSRLFKSTNGATSFTEITGTLPDRYYTDIQLDPNNDDRMLITLSGFGSGHIFYSGNGGTSWIDISGNLPDVPHNTALFDPSNTQTIVIGNDLGVYYTTGFIDGSTAPVWTPYNDGLTDATEVMDLAVASNGKLRMGTYGKGLWESDVPPSTQLITQASEFTNSADSKTEAVISSSLYPNPSKGGATISLNNIPKAGQAAVMVFNAAGTMVYKFNTSLHQGSNMIKARDEQLKSGTYLIVVETNGKRIVQKLIRL
jgi:hypothetical protein